MFKKQSDSKYSSIQATEGIGSIIVAKYVRNEWQNGNHFICIIIQKTIFTLKAFPFAVWLCLLLNLPIAFHPRFSLRGLSFGLFYRKVWTLWYFSCDVYCNFTLLLCSILATVWVTYFFHFSIFGHYSVLPLMRSNILFQFSHRDHWISTWSKHNLMMTKRDRIFTRTASTKKSDNGKRK